MVLLVPRVITISLQPRRAAQRSNGASAAFSAVRWERCSVKMPQRDARSLQPIMAQRIAFARPIQGVRSSSLASQLFRQSLRLIGMRLCFLQIIRMRQAQLTARHPIRSAAMYAAALRNLRANHHQPLPNYSRWIGIFCQFGIRQQ